MFCVAICHIYHKWWHAVWVGQAGYNQCKELAWCSICSDMTKIRVVLSLYSLVLTLIVYTRGRIRGDTRQLEKNRIFWHKIVIFFTRNTPKFFAPPSAIGKNMIFCRKFSHEIPQNFSRLPPLGAIFLSAPPPNLESWIRPWYYRTCIYVL